MKPGGGKAKGSSFEREICKDLSLWITGGGRDDIFWRSAMSGGRASVAFKKGGSNISQTGDICAVDPIGDPMVKKFFIECKFYANLNLQGSLVDSKSGITAFWDECRRMAVAQGNKIPFLVARQNQWKPWLILDSEGMEFFSLKAQRIALLPGEMQIVWWEKFLSHAQAPFRYKQPPLRKRL